MVDTFTVGSGVNLAINAAESLKTFLSVVEFNKTAQNLMVQLTNIRNFQFASITDTCFNLEHAEALELGAQKDLADHLAKNPKGSSVSKMGIAAGVVAVVSSIIMLSQAVTNAAALETLDQDVKGLYEKTHKLRRRYTAAMQALQEHIEYLTWLVNNPPEEEDDDWVQWWRAEWGITVNAVSSTVNRYHKETNELIFDLKDQMRKAEHREEQSRNNRTHAAIHLASCVAAIPLAMYTAGGTVVLASARALSVARAAPILLQTGAAAGAAVTIHIETRNLLKCSEVMKSLSVSLEELEKQKEEIDEVMDYIEKGQSIEEKIRSKGKGKGKGESGLTMFQAPPERI